LDSRETSNTSKNSSRLWEDIYGRTRDVAGNVVTATATAKYVPPALRGLPQAAGGKAASDAALLAKLSKQVKVGAPIHTLDFYKKVFHPDGVVIVQSAYNYKL
jgi:hypothetical protein